jgi:hypothetical protein
MAKVFVDLKEILKKKSSKHLNILEYPNPNQGIHIKSYKYVFPLIPIKLPTFYGITSHYN